MVKKRINNKGKKAIRNFKFNKKLERNTCFLKIIEHATNSELYNFLDELEHEIYLSNLAIKEGEEKKK